MIQKEKLKNLQILKMKEATRHNLKSVMFFYGFKPWMKYVLLLKKELVACEKFHQKNLLRAVFSTLRKRINDKRQREFQRAVDFNNFQIVKTSHNCIKTRLKIINSIRNEADYFSQKMKKKHSYIAWKLNFQIKKPTRIRYERNQCEKADNLAKRLVPKRCIREWRRFVIEKKEEQWREFRKDCLRKSVKNLLVNSSFEQHLQTATLSFQDMDTSLIDEIVGIE